MFFMFADPIEFGAFLIIDWIISAGIPKCASMESAKGEPADVLRVSASQVCYHLTTGESLGRSCPPQLSQLSKQKLQPLTITLKEPLKGGTAFLLSEAWPQCCVGA